MVPNNKGEYLIFIMARRENVEALQTQFLLPKTENRAFQNNVVASVIGEVSS